MMYAEKQFKGKLVLNWKTGEVKVYKEQKGRSPSKLSEWQVPVNFDITVVIPAPEEATVEGKIEVSRVKARDIIFKNV